MVRDNRPQFAHQVEEPKPRRRPRSPILGHRSRTEALRARRRRPSIQPASVCQSATEGVRARDVPSRGRHRGRARRHQSNPDATTQHLIVGEEHVTAVATGWRLDERIRADVAGVGCHPHAVLVESTRAHALTTRGDARHACDSPDRAAGESVATSRRRKQENEPDQRSRPVDDTACHRRANHHAREQRHGQQDGKRNKRRGHVEQRANNDPADSGRPVICSDDSNPEQHLAERRAPDPFEEHEVEQTR